MSGNFKWGAYLSTELFCLPSPQEYFGIVVVDPFEYVLSVPIAEPVNIATEVITAAAGLVHADTVVCIILVLLQWLVLVPQMNQQMGIINSKLLAEQIHFSSVAKSLLPDLFQSCL